jgi:hypothetical protein
MGFAWDPATVGSLEDEIGSVSRAALVEALLVELGQTHGLERAPISKAVLEAAAASEVEHRL